MNVGGYIDIFEAQTKIERLMDYRGGGNVVTALLAYAISNKLIRRALAVRYSKDHPAKAIPFVAMSVEDIVTCSGSKYTFVPYDDHVGTLDADSAIVGLPCQIRGIRKDVLRIGLFCGLNLSGTGLNYIFRKLRIKEKDVAHLDYRAPHKKGLLIKLKDGRIKHFPSYWWLAFFFCYKKCLYCTDYTNHFADISVGDRRPDWSAVIVRTERGRDLFQRAIEAGYLVANRIELDGFLSRTMSPMLQKEQKGGFVSDRLVRQLRGKWLELLPMSMLKRLGIYVAKRIKR